MKRLNSNRSTNPIERKIYEDRNFKPLPGGYTKEEALRDVIHLTPEEWREKIRKEIEIEKLNRK